MSRSSRRSCFDSRGIRPFPHVVQHVTAGSALVKTRQIDAINRLNVRTRYRMQRLIWIALGVILLFAVLGAFGNGRLSSATATSPSGDCQIEFQRVIRNHSPIELHVRARSNDGELLLLNIPRAFLTRCRMTQTTPEPWRSVAFADHVQLAFAVSRSQTESEVVLRLDAQAMGRIEGDFWIGPNERPQPEDVVRIHQFSLP